MKFSIILVLSLFTSIAFASTESKDFDINGLKTLELENDAGDIKISVTQDGKAHISATKVNFGENCTLKMQRSEDKLDIEVDKKGLFKSGECKVHFEIKVPREIALDIKSGSGDLNIIGTKGEVEFFLGSGDAVIDAEIKELNGKSGSGSLKISGTIGEADIKLGSGSIDIDGLTSEAEFKTGSGNLKITYKEAPVKGELDIKAGSGDATVYLPATSKISTSFISGSGRIYNELGDSSKAPFKISMKAGSGDLNIKKIQ
ncbi:MAG: DUF4097 family beta strand repeat-containing protein [Bdellovibrionota bacterium]